MPLYEYVCDACGHRFEIIQKFSDPAPAACPVCGKGPVVRQMSSPAIQFKGSGFYITDYVQKGKSEESGGGSKGESTKTDTAKSDTGTTSETATKSDTAAAPKGDKPSSG
jgi:putative FmdB family regulatory protein